MGMNYMVEEKIRHIKQNGGTVKNMLSFAAFALIVLGGVIISMGQVVIGIVSMIIGAISFFGLFPAEQIQKDITEVEKYFQSLGIK